jgi:twinkle protein
MKWEDIERELPNGKSSGQIKMLCPNCNHKRTDKHDKSLSVNVSEKTWYCHYCNEKGGAGEFSAGTIVTPKEIQTIITETANDLGLEAVKFLNSRGISEKTAEYFGIKEKRRELHFNYYLDGNIVNIKYRKIDEKKFRLSKGGTLIAYNIDSVVPNENCVIVEGEMDALAVHEAGVSGAIISVPNGANGLEWVDNSYSKLKSVKTFIIAMDSDKKGSEYSDELSRRLGKHRCKRVEYPKDTKDFNEVLLAYGKDKVVEIIDRANSYPLEGILTIDDWKHQLWSTFNKGQEKGDTIGMGKFDELLAFVPGQFTVVTGVPSSGKSEFLDQILVNLAFGRGEVKREWKFGMISFENQPVYYHIIKIMKKVLGKDFDPKSMSRTEFKNASLMIDEKFKFFNVIENDLTIDGIIDKAKELVGMFGINGLVIDPYNYIEATMDKGVTETNYISEVLSKIVYFAKEYQVHVFFVAHPTKILTDEKTGNFKVPNLYSISGSANWYNKADNGIVVWRDFNTNEIQVHIKKVRFAWMGKPGVAHFRYNTITGQYVPISI